MATADKLTYLSQTKSDIRDAIIAKGVSVPAATTFRDYVTKVGEISTGDPSKSKAYDYAERVSIDGGNVENVTAVKNLDTANTLLSFIPSGKKAGKAYSTTPIDGTGDFTVDRNSTSTYVAKDGLIKTALANEPRFDFSDGSAALLVEPQATNLLPYSSNYTVANWIKSKGGTGLVPVVTPNFASAPNGELTASRVQFDLGIGVTDSNYSYLNENLSLPSDFYTTSVWMKSNTGLNQYILFTNQGNNVGKEVLVTTEWQKFTLANSDYKNSNFITATQIYPIIALRGRGDNYYSSTNTAQTADILVWGAQLETGSVATSYIPTAGSTVTRLKDNITVNPPTGTTSIIETIDNIEQAPITTIPATYTVPNGNINKITMQ